MTSVHFGETPALEGIKPSIGTVGDAFDNALAETAIGLYKTECTRSGSPFRGGPFARLSDIEQATSRWVHWYNQDRLMHRLGRRTHRSNTKPTITLKSVTTSWLVTRNEGCTNPGWFSVVLIGQYQRHSDHLGL